MPSARSRRAKITASRSTPSAPPSAAAARTMASTPAALSSGCLRGLQHPAEGVLDIGFGELLLAEFGQRARPVDRFSHSGGFVEVELPQRADGGSDLPGQPLARLGHAQPHYGDFPLDVGVIDPVGQAAPFEGVMQIAGAMEVTTTTGGTSAATFPGRAPSRRNRTGFPAGTPRFRRRQGRFRQWGSTGEGPSRLSRARRSRSPDQEPLGEQLVFGGGQSLPATGFRRFEVQQLAGVIPFVDRLGHVDALVALQPQQLRPRQRARLGDLGFAGPGFTLQQ